MESVNETVHKMEVELELYKHTASEIQKQLDEEQQHSKIIEEKYKKICDALNEERKINKQLTTQINTYKMLKQN